MSRTLAFKINAAVRGPLSRVGCGHSQRQETRSGSSGRAKKLGRANLRSAGPVTLAVPGASAGAENNMPTPRVPFLPIWREGGEMGGGGVEMRRGQWPLAASFELIQSFAEAQDRRGHHD